MALAVMLVLRAPGAAASDEHPFEISVHAGRAIFDRELESGAGPVLADDFYFGAHAAATLVSPLRLELVAGLSNAGASGPQVTWSHFSANLLLLPSGTRVVNPFLSLGGGLSRFGPQHPVTIAGLTSETDGTFEAAAGLRIRLGDALGLRLEARNVLLVPRRDWDKSHVGNQAFTAGLGFAFGGIEYDNDLDGVIDRRDRCAGTPRGCTVDANGCPGDRDGDGVCDGVDRCPDTPPGARVDAGGCPRDADGDRVFDGLDRCDSTAAGCRVDAQGCPFDADGDGVCDGLDQCPDTRAGCAVDAAGCPFDSDRDGVCDGLDRCPDTPPGTRPDSSGCAPNEVGRRESELLETGVIRLYGVMFEPGGSRIRPESFAALEAVGAVLGRWPELAIEIGAHTDAGGSATKSLALSARQAATVRAYLLRHFPQLEEAHLASRGYGASRPPAAGTSAARAARNRRIDFTVTNREVLGRLKR